MGKTLEVKEAYQTWACARTVTVSGLVEYGLNRNDFDKLDSDVCDQARRIDADREAFGRLVEQLHAAGALSTAAAVAVADIDPDDVREAP